MLTPSLEPLAEAHAARSTATRLGLPASVALAFLAALGFLLGILTPPRSAPYCTGACIAYPYADAAQFFPRDYWWMLPGILLAPMFAVVCVCLHFCAPARSRPLSMLAVGTAMLSAGIIAIDYSVQVLALQPALRHGEMDGVAIFTQYNPHGVFIVLEDLGYLLLAIAFAFAAAVVPRAVRPGLSLRWTLLGASALSLVALAAFALLFGAEMALPFELAIITIVWMGLTIAGILFALLFKGMRRLQNAD